jgi:LmbE family N-acetylglucosaminyl deacetylase
MKKILILAPHTDDAEFGMGGTISRLIEENNEVHCAAFSACEQSILPDFPKDILIREVKAASAALGVSSEKLHLFNYDVRTFSFHRQAILDDIIELRTLIQPDIVFIPSLKDVHQDHIVIAEEGRRAFKFSTLLSYELPWNQFTFSSSCFFTLELRHVEKKVESIALYKSQSHRKYSNAEFIRALAKTRGVQINTEFAECFETVRLVN